MFDLNVVEFKGNIYFGSLGIAPTWKCTHFLKNGFVVGGAGFIPIISTKGINKMKKGNS